MDSRVSNAGWPKNSSDTWSGTVESDVNCVDDQTINLIVVGGNNIVSKRICTDHNIK